MIYFGGTIERSEVCQQYKQLGTIQINEAWPRIYNVGYDNQLQPGSSVSFLNNYNCKTWLFHMHAEN